MESHRRNGVSTAAGEATRHMAHALRLAEKAAGATAPNPAVGAVIVSNGRVVGSGYHRRTGAPHAEVEALRRAGERARGATLYVTLEPCAHHGRTPPCCDAIRAAGIARVVIADRDSNPVTHGRGIARLKRAGVRVVTGVLARQAHGLNAPFHKAMRTGLPLVIAKVGQSLDGKIATAGGESRWITSPAPSQPAHEWRSQVDAVLVGVNTIITDDPRLTVRGAPSRPGRPIRVIVDSRLRTPKRARCLTVHSTAPTWIATTVRPAQRAARGWPRGVEILTVPARNGRVGLRSLCRVLARRGVHSVLLEGGGEVLAGALAERIIDRVLFMIAPVLIGGRDAPGSFGGAGVRRLARAVRLSDVVYYRVGPDLCVDAKVRYPHTT